MLRRYDSRNLDYQTMGDRAFQARYSFARCVSRSVLQEGKLKKILKDGASSALVLTNENCEDGLCSGTKEAVTQ